MDRDARIADWYEWKQANNMDTHIMDTLFDDYYWNWDVLYPEGKAVFQHKKSIEWQKEAGNNIIPRLTDLGIMYGSIMYPEYYPGQTYEDKLKDVRTGLELGDYVFEIPAAKSLDSFVLDLNSNGINRPSQILDYLRFTIIGKTPQTCQRIQESLYQIIEEHDWFAPLSEEERKINGKKIPVTTDLVYKNSADELKRQPASQTLYAGATHFQVALGARYRQQHADGNGFSHDKIPPGLRVEVSVVSPEYWKCLNNPNSPASQGNDPLRADMQRFKAYLERISTDKTSPWETYEGYMLLAQAVLEQNADAIHILEQEIYNMDRGRHLSE